MGASELRQAVADQASRLYGIEIDPEQGVVITAGATEAILSSILGLVDPGNKVVIIEPYFDSYLPNISMAGAEAACIPLRPSSWELDPDEQRAAFQTRPRVVLLNSPHNPTGRIFSRGDLRLIADLCVEFDVVAISDEVYEHLVPLMAGQTSDRRPNLRQQIPGILERVL